MARGGGPRGGTAGPRTGGPTRPSRRTRGSSRAACPRGSSCSTRGPDRGRRCRRTGRRACRTGRPSPPGQAGGGDEPCGTGAEFIAHGELALRMAKAVQPEDLAAYSMLSEPSLSPDGAFAALSVHRARLDKDEYEGNIWIVPLDGKAPRRLTTSGKDGAPKVSPDGKRILFTSKRGLGKEDKGNALYVIRTKAGAAKLVLRRKEGIEGPAWSPDGKRVLFLSNVGQDDEDVRTIRRINFWFNDKGFIYNLRKHVFLLNLATKAVKQVTKGEVDVTKGAWSHDGKRIAYIAQTEDLRPYLQDVFVIEVASGKTTQLTNHTMEIASVAWSPDDRRLVLRGDDLPRGFASHEHLWIVDAKGGTPERLDSMDRNLSNALNCDVRMGGMSPDPKWVGDHIYFVAAEGGGVHLYSIDVKSRRATLVVGGERSIEAFQVNDRARIFTGMETMSLPELYRLDTEPRKLTSFNEKARTKLAIRTAKPFTFRASDGVDVEGWILRH